MKTKLAAFFLVLLSTQASTATIDGKATIIDGDTIAVEGTGPRIRLDGIDAPESSQPCINSSGAKFLCGSSAAETLTDIIGRNGRVTCTEKERDRYGRIVAVCSVGNTEINREMVRRGWAIEFKKYSDGRYAAVEQEAREAKVGLWAGAFDEPAEWRRKKRVGEAIESPTSSAAVAPLGLMAAATKNAPTKELPTTSATSCKAVKNCREAVILWCSGYSRADADSDGIPCENVCRSLAQVEPFKKEIGCER